MVNTMNTIKAVSELADFIVFIVFTISFHIPTIQVSSIYRILVSNQGTRFYKHNPSPTFHSYILDFCDVHVHSPLPPTFSLLPASPLPPLHSYLPCKAFPHCGFWCWLGFFNFCV